MPRVLLEQFSGPASHNLIYCRSFSIMAYSSDLDFDHLSQLCQDWVLSSPMHERKSKYMRLLNIVAPWTPSLKLDFWIEDYQLSRESVQFIISECPHVSNCSNLLKLLNLMEVSRSRGRKISYHDLDSLNLNFPKRSVKAQNLGFESITELLQHWLISSNFYDEFLENCHLGVWDY